MTQIGMHEETKLSQLVERARAGEDITITRKGTPVAELVAVRPASGLASAHGALRGQIRLADDFDVLPEDLADALGAG